ncbi:MAG: hypothetical protein N5P05_004159 (plasmid) [Chroococcopsis gigantea SAG 12.99]|nr:hypothetical protein [Chroococcopsis gigantea SAG 12.99]
MSTSKDEYFYPLTAEEMLKLHKLLKVGELKIYLYLVSLPPNEMEDLRIDTANLAKNLKVTQRTVQRCLVKLKKLALLPEWLAAQYREPDLVEGNIRNNLQTQLGGLTEVPTPAGKIDLLTKTEMIEVKNIKDWKNALGQILAYSAFYPKHEKRIHLFGRKADLKKLLDIESACVGFGIKVTGEEV